MADQLYPDPVRLKAQVDPTDKLVMAQPGLKVLGHHVNVLEPALDGVTDHRGGRTGVVVDGVDDLRRLPNGMRRGETQVGALFEGERACRAERVPERAYGLVQERPSCAGTSRTQVTGFCRMKSASSGRGFQSGCPCQRTVRLNMSSPYRTRKSSVR